VLLPWVKCLNVQLVDPKMQQHTKSPSAPKISRDKLAELLNEDLAREYQAIIAYVVYSQVLKGAEFMSIAEQLETHAQQELEHALIISRQIDYLRGFNFPAHRNLRVSEGVENLLRW
jgi:bacterioferritin